MLLILGDLSAKGSELTRSWWSSVLQQFHRLLGPFLGLPFHVILGDRDIGDCSELNAISVIWLVTLPFSHLMLWHFSVATTIYVLALKK